MNINVKKATGVMSGEMGFEDSQTMQTNQTYKPHHLASHNLGYEHPLGESSSAANTVVNEQNPHQISSFGR